MLKIMLCLIITINLFSKTMEYTCIVNIKDTKKRNEAYLTIEKEWYGKPTALVTYENDKVKEIIPNIQTKKEWFMSSESIFKLIKKDTEYFLTLSNNPPFKLTGYLLYKGKKMEIVGQCVQKKIKF